MRQESRTGESGKCYVAEWRSGIQYLEGGVDAVISRAFRTGFFPDGIQPGSGS